MMSRGVLFFDKHETAYEMRISDWSSDVCSSDLREAVRYDGENSNKEDRRAVREAWTRRGSEKRFFIGNAQAGGTGLDWINGASTVIYYSNSFSSLDRWQSEDRTHRIGTKGTVNY